MFGLPPSVRIYFATDVVDMRNGIDGLRAIVDGVYWDRNGFVVTLKRLERGRFQLPVVDARRRHVEMEATQLAMLLDGVDLNARRLSRWSPSIERGIDGERRS
jgi:transposase